MDESDLIEKLFGEPEEDAEAIERARARLVRVIRAEEDRTRRRRRLLLPAAATIAIAAGAAIVLALVMPMGGSTAAATELRRLARIASSAGAPDVGPGEYLLVVSEELRPESFTPLGPDSPYTRVSHLRVRTWVARDGSTIRETEVIDSRFASDADRRAWVDAGRPEVFHRAGETIPEKWGAGEGFWLDMSTIPREPDPLLAALRSGQIAPRPPGDEQVFLLIGELLAQGDAPPDLRASLLEAAAGLPDVQEVGDVIDPLGREGRALAVDGATLRTQLVFDPETAELLSIEIYDLGVSEDAPRSWMAFQPARVVGSAPQF